MAHIQYKCNSVRKKWTHRGYALTMVFADNQMKGGNPMSHYKHLSIEEREKLYLMHGQGKSFREIARALHRSASTVTREYKRGRDKKHSYLPFCHREHSIGMRSGGRTAEGSESYLIRYTESKYAAMWKICTGLRSKSLTA